MAFHLCVQSLLRWNWLGAGVAGVCVLDGYSDDD